MRIKHQIVYLREKKIERYLKSNQNRDKLLRITYFIEGEEIEALKNCINEAFSYEELTGWEMTFMESILNKINSRNKNILYFTEKQIKPIEEIVRYTLIGLSDRERRIKETRGRGYFFKKLNQNKGISY